MCCPTQKVIIYRSGFPQFIHVLILAVPCCVVINLFISVFPNRRLILDLADGPLICQSLAPDIGMACGTCSINVLFLLSEICVYKSQFKVDNATS